MQLEAEDEGSGVSAEGSMVVRLLEVAGPILRKMKYYAKPSQARGQERAFQSAYAKVATEVLVGLTHMENQT